MTEQSSSVHNVPPYTLSMHKSQDVEEGYSDQSLINDLLCVAVTLHTLLWLALSALLRQSSGQEAIHVLGDSSSPSPPSSRSSGGWSLRPLDTISRSRTPTRSESEPIQPRHLDSEKIQVGTLVMYEMWNQLVNPMEVEVDLHRHCQSSLVPHKCRGCGQLYA